MTVLARYPHPLWAIVLMAVIVAVLILLIAGDTPLPSMLSL